MYAKVGYKTETRPGLVALYVIWPGNAAGPFLQPRSPHGFHVCAMRRYFVRAKPQDCTHETETGGTRLDATRYALPTCVADETNGTAFEQ